MAGEETIKCGCELGDMCVCVFSCCWGEGSFCGRLVVDQNGGNVGICDILGFWDDVSTS